LQQLTRQKPDLDPPAQCQLVLHPQAIAVAPM